MSKPCPYCGTQNGKKSIVDQAHLTLKNMSRPSNTRNVYQCSECEEEYESHMKSEDYTSPVDMFFDRPRQYGKEKYYQACHYDKF